MQRSLASRRGFTLVEMLVVIAIIGTLAALLLPAVQAARERGRQAQCTNNMKQLAIASHLHHDAFKTLPSGGWGWYWTGDGDRGGGKDQPGSWAFAILPFIEQTAVFNLASDGDANNITAAQKAGAAQAARTPVKTFYCPTRRMPRAYPHTQTGSGSYNMDMVSEAARSDYAANAGDAEITWGAGPAPANGFAGNGFANMTGSTGVTYQRSDVGLAGVLDGTSHVYMLGERQLDRKYWERGHIAPMQTDDHPCWVGDDYDMHVWAQNPPAPDWIPNLRLRYGSAHNMVFYVALCDASVRSVRMNIDLTNHRRFAHRYDQKPASLD